MLRTFLCFLILVSGARAQDVSIVGVRVFDGERVQDGVTVNVSNGRIEAMGPSLEPLAGVTKVEGAGRTLIPGLIDAHTHVQVPGDLVTAAEFGVTTELDMFTVPEFAAMLRKEQGEDSAHHRADMFSCGIPVTAPGGHCTQFGLEIPTLSRLEDVESFVDARLAEGADYVKIVYDDVKFLGLALPTLSRDVAVAAIASVKKKGNLAVAHIGTQRDFQHMVEGGIGGTVHVFCDVAPETAVIEAAVRARVFVVPTMSVIQGVLEEAGGATLVKDERLASWFTKAEVKHLATRYPGKFAAGPSFAHARSAVTRLHAAGIPILAGSDAPNPGTMHGATIHRELELMVAAGLTPREALEGATRLPAREFGLADRGRIAPGLRADLVLVEGDPTRDILATRALVTVWKAGRPIDRGSRRSRVRTEKN